MERILVIILLGLSVIHNFIAFFQYPTERGFVGITCLALAFLEYVVIKGTQRWILNTAFGAAVFFTVVSVLGVVVGMIYLVTTDLGSVSITIMNGVYVVIFVLTSRVILKRIRRPKR